MFGVQIAKAGSRGLGDDLGTFATIANKRSVSVCGDYNVIHRRNVERPFVLTHNPCAFRFLERSSYRSAEARRGVVQSNLRTQ